MSSVLTSVLCSHLDTTRQLSQLLPCPFHLPLHLLFLSRYGICNLKLPFEFLTHLDNVRLISTFSITLRSRISNPSTVSSLSPHLSCSSTLTIFLFAKLSLPFHPLSLLLLLPHPNSSSTLMLLQHVFL